MNTAGNSNKNACFKLEADIPLAGTNNWTPIEGFAGTFDGQGHTITGLNITKTTSNVGFFGSTDGDVVIENLTLGSGTVTATQSGGFWGVGTKNADNVAALVGGAGGKSLTIINCVSKINVTAKGSDVGGLVGYASVPVTIVGSGNEGSVKSDGNQIGGLIGQTTGTLSITNSYNTGDISGPSSGNKAATGGLAGSAEIANIECSYNSGSVTGFSSDPIISRSKESNVTGTYSAVNTYTTGSATSSVSGVEKKNSVAEIATQLAKDNPNAWAVDGDNPVQIHKEQVGDADVNWSTRTATLVDGSGKESVSYDAMTVDHVVLDRKFTSGSVATIVLPITVPVSDISGAKVYYFNKVAKNAETGRWKVTMTTVKDQVVANTPYALIPSAETVEFTGGPYTFTATSSEPMVVERTAEAPDEDITWSFIGVSSKYQAASEGGNSEIGWDYCYAAQTQEEGGIRKGQFTITDGWVDPMHAYLHRNPVKVAGNSLAKKSALSYDYDAVVESLDVEFDDENGTMAIGHLNSATGIITIDRWVDLKGRKIQGKPSAKGAYFNNHKKVIVK
ncbi:MAG: hypothetical protein MJZ10_09365 [Fibrobacter sp.]|nr:hypothetical protein [Fibrobacter sp.]